MSTTRCRVCDCKLKSGDICPRCEREQEWLNTPEYFCTSQECGRLLPGATGPGLCEKCKERLSKPAKIKIMEEKMSKETEKTCPVCGRGLTKNGFCHSCNMKGKKNRLKSCDKTPQSEKENWRPSSESCCKCSTVTPLDLMKKMPDGLICPTCAGEFDKKPAPKSDAESYGHYPPPVAETAAATIHASPAPIEKPVIKIDELDVCRDVINKHGISRQLAKAAEEFSEAAAAISRFLAGEGEYTEIISEVADVEVMCVQMRLIYGVDSIDQARAEKVARLQERLKTEF